MILWSALLKAGERGTSLLLCGGEQVGRARPFRQAIPGHRLLLLASRSCRVAMAHWREFRKLVFDAPGLLVIGAARAVRGRTGDLRAALVQRVPASRGTLPSLFVALFRKHE